MDMSLYVISACNLKCPECIMAHLMSHEKSYQMSIPEIERLLEVSEACDYTFNFVITGGEPLLWKNLKEAVRLLRKSPVTQSMVMFSNVVNISQVDDELMDSLKQLRVSRYEDARNWKNTKILLERYPDKMRVVPRDQFWVNPTQPVPGTTPAHCLNPEILYQDYKVYACPHSASIAIGCAAPLEGLYAELKPNFLDEMETIRKGQEENICSRCISNKLVREKVGMTSSVNLTINKKPLRVKLL
jgi:hypothetical protein